MYHHIVYMPQFLALVLHIALLCLLQTMNILTITSVRKLELCISRLHVGNMHGVA